MRKEVVELLEKLREAEADLSELLETLLLYYLPADEAVEYLKTYIREYEIEL